MVTVLGFLIFAAVRSLLMASRRTEFPERSAHLTALVRDLSLAIGAAIVGVTLLATLRLWNVGPGLGDLLRTGLGIPIYLLFAWAVWRHKRTMAVAVAGPRPRSRWRSRLARAWPAIVIAFLVITFLSTQAALTLGASLRGSAVLLTALMFLAAPHLDAMIGNWAQRGLESPDISILAAAGRQTARFTVLAIMIAMLGTLWATPLAAGFGIDLREVAKGASGVALIMLVAAFLWNVVGTGTARALRAELPAVGGDEEVLGAPRSRLGTLVPLLSAVGKSSILALALLSILVSIGVNVWPLIAGLSVFGLAIGFGSQTLVKDLVSGLFFLIDDAFRFGEYIETSGAKGTVEKISVRSVSLRHQRGALATIPYGEIGKIQNFSRDWMIEKLTFPRRIRHRCRKSPQNLQEDRPGHFGRPGTCWRSAGTVQEPGNCGGRGRHAGHSGQIQGESGQTVDDPPRRFDRRAPRISGKRHSGRPEATDIQSRSSGTCLSIPDSHGCDVLMCADRVERVWTSMLRGWTSGARRQEDLPSASSECRVLMPGLAASSALPGKRWLRRHLFGIGR